MSELLNCPFCEGEAYTVGDDELYWTVECHDCCAHTGGYAKREFAIEAWNTRAERTCHDTNTRFNAWTCSECKCTLLLVFDDYGEPSLSIDGVADVPKYCPNCGRKVVSE